MLYLSKDLYRAWIKLQADKDLGRTYGGLLPFVEGLYRFGYLSQDVYEENIKKYSEPLTSKEKPNLEQQKQTQFLMEKDRQLKGMLEQWEDHPDKTWRVKAIAEAKKYPEFTHAKMLLSKIDESLP